MTNSVSILFQNIDNSEIKFDSILNYFAEKLFFAFFDLMINKGFKNFFKQVIAAEGEQKASRALREAADVISQSPSALQVEKIIFLNN